MKIFTQSVYILSRNREDLCSCFWIYLLLFKECELLLVVFQCFFNERAAVSEKLFKRKKGASERYQLYIKKEILRRKFAAAYDNLRNILKWKQIKIKTMVTLWKPVTFMYFLLNYCDEKIERIPVAVKNIDHLFNMASEIIEADKLHLFLLSAALELMIMNT